MAMVKYQEEDSHLHNCTPMLFTCHCVSNKGEFLGDSLDAFFFCSPSPLQVSPYMASEHDDKRLKRAEWDQREKINFSPLDPVTQEPRESLSGSPSQVCRGCATLKSGRGSLGGWTYRSAKD